MVADYSNSNIGVGNFHHNIDPGKTGLFLEPDTTTYFESIILEVDKDDGHLLKTFNMAQIISAAMRAGGDDPSEFVFQGPGHRVTTGSITTASRTIGPTIL